MDGYRHKHNLNYISVEIVTEIDFSGCRIRPFTFVEVGASCFWARTCMKRSHSVHKSEALVRPIRTDGSEDGFRLRRRCPFTGGSECPTPTGWTLDCRDRCTLFVAFEQRMQWSECLTIPFDCRDSKAMADSESNQRRRAYPLPTRSLRSLLEERGLPACNSANVDSTFVRRLDVLPTKGVRV